MEALRRKCSAQVRTSKTEGGVRQVTDRGQQSRLEQQDEASKTGWSMLVACLCCEAFVFSLSLCLLHTKSVFSSLVISVLWHWTVTGFSYSAHLGMLVWLVTGNL